MSERSELLEATFDGHPEGIALLGRGCCVALWNRPAEAITGFLALDLVGRPAPDSLQALLHSCAKSPDSVLSSSPDRGCLLHIHHKLGHTLPVFARIMLLRDSLGGRIGTALIFHPADTLDALPHGESGDDAENEASEADFEDRRAALFEDFLQGGLPFWVLWITADQARDLRRTHGANACDEMLEKVGHSLSRGLRPGEELRRWGDDEFLILSYERTPDMLAAHAELLAGLARTTDFRWWAIERR